MVWCQTGCRAPSHKQDARWDGAQHALNRLVIHLIITLPALRMRVYNSPCHVYRMLYTARQARVSTARVSNVSGFFLQATANLHHKECSE